MIVRIYHTVTYRKNIHTKISVPYAFKVDIKKGTWSIYQSTFPYQNAYKKPVVLLHNHVTESRGPADANIKSLPPSRWIILIH